jgi:hypothetical protein
LTTSIEDRKELKSNMQKGKKIESADREEKRDI